MASHESEGAFASTMSHVATSLHIVRTHRPANPAPSLQNPSHTNTKRSLVASLAPTGGRWSNAVADTEPTETQVFSIEPDGDADDASPARLVWGKLVALGGACFTDVLVLTAQDHKHWVERMQLAGGAEAACQMPVARRCTSCADGVVGGGCTLV